MWQKTGIIRTPKGLRQASKKIVVLRKLLSHKIHPDVIETNNMLQTANLIIKAALKRQKSLGTHFRMD